MTAGRTGGFTFVILVALVACSSVWAGWSTPELLSDLNGPTGEIAASPSISSDGLTIYFQRRISNEGPICITEATRTSPMGQFTSERVLTELLTGQAGTAAPWISQDGSRLYYSNWDSGIITMAQRGDTNDIWAIAKTFEELHAGGAQANQVALTSDELTIFFTSKRTGGMGEEDLWMGIRNSTEEPFGNLRPLYELNTSGSEYGPHVSPDGLTLYFQGHDRDGHAGSNIFRSTRESTIANFEYPELVPVPSDKPQHKANPSVTSNEKAIFFDGGVDDDWGIWTSQWVEIVGVFHVDAVKGDNGNDGLAKQSAFATIQHAVNMCADGSTILVWPGVYNEQINFTGKAITVKSAAEAAEIRAIDGKAFSFVNGEDADAVLRNFVITNSQYAIYVDNTSYPTISNLTIVGNDYGIAAFGESDPDISNCILWANTDGDLIDCRATYSCIQSGDPGEGNIDAYPMFADPASKDYHLLSERGRVIPVDPTLPPWTEPVHVPELDDAQGNRAGAPCLSSDGLTMYFQRKIESSGPTYIVEATRAIPAGEFTSERVLTELTTGNVGVVAPWISEDRLRLYYCDWDTPTGAIKMAQRPSPSDTWTPTRAFEELDAFAVQPTLTGDELQIFFHSARAGSAGGTDLWTASRTSIEEPFGNIRPLYEINTSENENGPHIMPDGLTLYFLKYYYRDNQLTVDLVKTTRDSRSDTFGDTQFIKSPNHNLITEYNPCVTPDEKTIYIYRDRKGIYKLELLENTWMLDRANSPCIDAGDPATNPADEPMPNGGRVNMGAYGGTTSASMSQWPLKGDINRNGTVDLADFTIIANDWLEKLPWFTE